MAKPYSIIVFGEPLIEVICERKPTDEELADQKKMSAFLRRLPINAASGDALNFLGNYTVLNRLLSDKKNRSTEKAGLLSSIGNDVFGKKIKQTVKELANEAVDIDAGLLRLNRGWCSGIYGIHRVDKAGHYQFYFDRFGYAFENMVNTDSFQATLRTAKQADFFYTTGIALMMTKHYRLFTRLFSELKKAGTKIVFDTNYRALVARHAGIASLPKFLASLLANVDILLAGEEDARNLYPEIKDLPTEKLVGLCFSRWCKEGLSKSQIIIKCGEQGVYWFNKGLRHLPIVNGCLSDYEDQMVHPEGAGDAFNAGFMVSYKKNHNIETSVRLGLLTGWLMTRYRGCFRKDEPFISHKDLLFNTLNQQDR